jgi:hypothetical protein
MPDRPIPTTGDFERLVWAAERASESSGLDVEVTEAEDEGRYRTTINGKAVTGRFDYSSTWFILVGVWRTGLAMSAVPA